MFWALNTCSTIKWRSVSYSSFTLACLFWIVNCDSDVFMVWQLWQWILAAELIGSQWITRLLCYDVFSGLSIVKGTFFRSDALGIEHLPKPNWLSVIYLASIVRRKLWIVNCASDLFMVSNFLQWITGAKLSGSQWVTRLSIYHIFFWIVDCNRDIFWSVTFGSDYRQHNCVVLSELLLL